MIGGSAAWAGEFVLSNPGGTWNTIYGQGFSPAVEPSPNPGALTTAYLEEFEFYKSGVADSATNFQLAILNAFYYDFNVQLTTGSGALLGLSNNTIASTAGLNEFDPITFDFSSLALPYGGSYGAVFVKNDGSGNLNPVLVSALTGNYEETPPGSGSYIPVPNYGGIDSYNYTTSNFINGGFFAAFSRAGDARFTATFNDGVVPEPSSVLLALCGMVLLATKLRADKR
jgi:hypothetical protein